jgi:hypothetical protein
MVGRGGRVAFTVSLVAVFAIALAVEMAAQAFAPILTHAARVATMTRISDGGPSYRVQVFADGTVVWHGYSGVEACGDRAGTIAPGMLRALVAAFERAHFSERESSHECCGHSRTVMSFHEHEVVGHRRDLLDLQNVFDTLVVTGGWIGRYGGRCR